MMTKKLLNSGVLLAALCLAGAVAAQSPVALATRQAELRALSAALYQRDLRDRQAVQAYARRLGIAVRRELPDGRVLELQRLLPGPLLSQRPVFYITNNIVAADTVSTDEVWPGGSAGLDLDGGGMSVAQWDGGAVFGFSYHDLMARLKVLGPDNAWQRLREIIPWFEEVQAAGGYRKYYDGSREGSLQGGGTAGGLGLVGRSALRTGAAGRGCLLAGAGLAGPARTAAGSCGTGLADPAAAGAGGIAVSWPAAGPAAGVGVGAAPVRRLHLG